MFEGEHLPSNILYKYTTANKASIILHRVRGVENLTLSIVKHAGCTLIAGAIHGRHAGT